MQPHGSWTASRGAALAVAALLVLAAWAAYRPSFAGVFVFDDISSIPANPTLRHLWPLKAAWAPPAGARTVSGRPLLNFSFALNYAAGGAAPWGYHAVNLGIHVVAALTLFGIVRRTLARAPGGADRALRVGAATALLWVLHPLQTEAVTYVVQRAESLMGLWYLLTLYCFLRGAEQQDRGAAPGAARGWYGAAVAACLLGAATKEVIVSAPVMLAVYDRTFLAGSFRAAWTRRRGVYAALAASWILLAALVLSNPGRGGSVGWHTALPSAWCYWATQGPAVLRYLRLAVWPAGQTLDYGFEHQWYEAPLSGLPADAAVALLVGATVWSLVRRPALGFLGLWFFAILAPTALVPGMRQTMVEHRMYLALAAVLAGMVWAVDVLIRCLLPYSRWAAGVFWAGMASAALLLGTLTYNRNLIYSSVLSIWTDATVKVPQNAFAQNNRGSALLDLGRLDEALACYDRALRLDPSYVEARLNRARALERLGQDAAAAADCERAVQREPANAEAHLEWGLALAGAGQTDAAITQLTRAVQLAPADAAAHCNLGVAYAQRGLLSEAAAHLTEAIRLQPDYAAAELNLGAVLQRLGRTREAIAHYSAALRLDPQLSVARQRLEQLRGAGEAELGSP